MADKIKEGLELMDAGRKATEAESFRGDPSTRPHHLRPTLPLPSLSSETKKSFFGKPNPDWDTALSNYERAANSFKGARAFDHAVDAYIKAAEAHKNMDR
ncbi:hypothetical protein BDK51DRAFT_41424 [Blyttiomyces helicus]|uniref:Uncharacterized protein n=1 Tax=Blyttiomyces helicus TaxID=388810 RepID=A0A4P9W3W2_9FUNG|nr:hypothetical protein BDK51DRAFT_41424 [Blyttiomyces helicus]|eukprot:RKO85995.1 hypothetical protein BDK51DRAFT_41424 [Blyttiomyces helicus]